MKIPIYQVDAFTNQIFGGNPAAVCLLDYWLDDKIMQNIGAENNLAETAFLVKKEGFYEIRWFTPKIEVDLCGHATLASAHVLFNHIGIEGNKVEFKTTHHGMLAVTKSGDLLTLDFPASEPVQSKITDELLYGLGKTPQAAYKTRDMLAIFETEEDILNINPNFEALKKLDQLGVIVSAPGKNSDFVSRFFAPNAGINEDPVTGSAHTTLIPYWAKRLAKNKIHAFQFRREKGNFFAN